MTIPSAYKGFRVVIAGGGLGGLTLANALERAGIDYVLLEARAVIDPAVGASMGIMPNGSRILDQLDCFDDILDLTYPIQSSGNHTGSGKLIHPRLDSPLLGFKRTGYEAVFLNRQLVLQVLYKHLKDKSKILTGKRISSVDHTAEGVTVRCEDGSNYAGDIIAGADGIFSTVRQEMWRIADQEDPGFISKEEKGRMSAEYQVLFGISTATAGLKVGNYDITYMKDVSSMNIVGKDNVVYWFLFKRMDKICKMGEIPRYTKAEAEAFAERYADLNLDKDPDVKFGDVWKNRTYYTLVATEEADFVRWTWGRFACLGDSVHKVTPNAGIGGNAAYESAAALANSIKVLLDSNTTRPTLEQVKHALKRYETSRKERASALNKIANSVTRLQALKGIVERILVYYIIPNSGDQAIEMISDFLIGATKIDYLPPPKRSLTSTMPFNPQQGIGKKESILYRMLLAVPFFALSAFAFNRMNAGVGFKDLAQIMQNGRITWNESSFSLPGTFFGIEWLDNMIRPMTIVFSSSNFGIDPVSWWQMLSFITDLGVLYSILLIEATRRAGVLTFAQIPFLFTMAAQFVGIGVIGPIYFALHYIASQIANFKALDLRLTNLAYTRTVLPVMIVSFYIPHYVSYLAPDLAVRHAANWIWQLCPVWMSGLQMLLANTVMPSTIQHDRIYTPKRDLTAIRFTVGACIVLSGAVWLYTVIMSPFSIKVLFYPGLELSRINWVECARGVLQFDYLFCWASALLWLGYLFADMKHAGMVQQSWGTILGAAALMTFGLGPGVAVGLGWLWRENVLVTKRHGAAIVAGDVAVEERTDTKAKKDI